MEVDLDKQNQWHKHAVLIMAHKQFELLKKLLQMLDHECMDIYIHVDKKSRKFKREEFERVCKKSKVVFIPRMKVYWGDSSQVECELRLMEAALASKENYIYLHLLSGDDLQIKQTEDILDFFENHLDKQFIAFRNTMTGISGLNRYYFFMPLRYYNKYIAKGLDIISAYIQKILHVNRLRKCDFALCKSQQWFSITCECAEYVVSQREFIRRLVRFSSCSDEMFLGTVIVNSPFREQIYHPYRSLIGHMRLIDRERPEKASPHTFTMYDWKIIQESPCFWARKFNIERDFDIIDKVFETWR